MATTPTQIIHIILNKLHQHRHKPANEKHEEYNKITT